MPFKKGNKLGGRKPGSVSKKTFDAAAICEKHGYDPIEALIELGKTSRDESIRVSCHKEVARYVYTQKRITEISGPEGGAVQVESSEVKEILADLKSILDTKVHERGQA